MIGRVLGNTSRTDEGAGTLGTLCNQTHTAGQKGAGPHLLLQQQLQEEEGRRRTGEEEGVDKTGAWLPMSHKGSLVGRPAVRRWAGLLLSGAWA